ncbi:MAG: hypothetical protein IH587_11280 [Anaerolineae bacterium]|nr:hypothetical protein [Anaerolineae bacterium]
MNKKKVVLNRAIFSARPLDSSALTVLATLIHRFPEPGSFELLIRRNDKIVHRAPVRVVKADATYQIDVNMTALDDGGDDCCSGEKSEYVLNAGGGMTFHATQGLSAYSVSIAQIDEREKRTLLDSREVIPAGDLFAVTLVRPGLYKVSAGDASAEIRVGMPKMGSGFRADEATLVDVGRAGLRTKSSRILAGQTIVFQMSVPGRIRVELTEPDKSTLPGDTRGKFTVQNPRAALKPAAPQDAPKPKPPTRRGSQKRAK